MADSVLDGRNMIIAHGGHILLFAECIPCGTRQKDIYIYIHTYSTHRSRSRRPPHRRILPRPAPHHAAADDTSPTTPTPAPTSHHSVWLPIHRRIFPRRPHPSPLHPTLKARTNPPRAGRASPICQMHLY
jgi:hypothetical protein